MKNESDGRRTSHCAGTLVWLALLVAVSGLSGCSTAKSVLGETAFVAPEKVRVRSTTAEASRVVGEVKSGDQVTVTERKHEGNAAWANINGPNGVSGWVEARYLVKQEIVDATQKLADEIRNIPTQAVGKSKATLKLRLTPDRNDDGNVAFTLPAGTAMEIVARDRQPRPEKLEAAAKPTPPPPGKAAAAPSGPRYDDWYKVRLKNYAIVPAGWIYGGSVELDVPQDITFFASTGRRITGWQKLGSNNDEQGQVHDTLLVTEKLLFDADERLDYDRIKVLQFDPRRKEYGTPFREDVAGRFPVTTKMEGSRGQFQITGMNKDNQTMPIDYAVELLEGGKAKVTRLTPKPAPEPKKK